MALQSSTSLAPSWSRMRSSTSPAAASEAWPSGAPRLRRRVAVSLACISSVEPARLTPAESAPSTFTSNQLSMERATNW